MNDYPPPKTTRDLISEFLIGIGVLIGLTIVLTGTVGLIAFSAWSNGQKVQDMTRTCIEQGYGGWSDDYGEQTSKCVSSQEED